jgi:peptidoglycan/LPS O-acetylase OafA/YrhL
MQTTQKILPLTSLRFFAALFVIMFHTTPSIWLVNSPLPVASIIKFGFTAVGFFFTLSGYILAIVYLSKGAVLNHRRFWLSRFARVYPLFVLTLILDAPNLLLSRIATYGTRLAVAKTGITFLANLAMLQSWLLACRGIDNPNWSLAVEAFFYLIFPFIAYSLWRVSQRSTLFLFGVVYIVGMTLPLLGTLLHLDRYLIMYNPLFHIPEFIAGILLARWHTSLLAERDSLKALQRWCLPMIFLSMGLFGLVVVYSACIPFVVIHDGLLIPISALVIIGCASGNELLGRLLSPRFLVVLGESSYAMYLIHIPIWHVVERAHLSQNVGIFPAYLVIVIGLSIASLYWFETPLRHQLLKWVDTASKERLLERRNSAVSLG